MQITLKEGDEDMKKFVDPELNVQRLQLEDVIATSNGGVSGDASTGGDDGRQ